MGLATRMLAFARRAAGLALRRPKDALIVLLVILGLAQSWRLRRTERHATALATKIEGLPPDTKQVATLYRDRVVTKWRDGPTKIEYRDRYLPPEGHVEVVTKVDQPEKPPEMIVKDRGFTSRLGGGVVYAGEALALIDWKLAFWRRYSFTAGVTPRFGGLGVSRHVDDFTPFQNLEVLGIGGATWQGDPRFGVGVRINF